MTQLFKSELAAAVMVVCLAGSIVASALPATAASPRRGAEGSVQACSHRGHGCITVQVRQGQHGPEVRLPGGTWVDCAGDCRLTAVEQSIDFWDKQIEGKPDNNG